MKIPRETTLDCAAKFGAVAIWARELEQMLIHGGETFAIAATLRRLDERYEESHRRILAILEDLNDEQIR